MIDKIHAIKQRFNEVNDLIIQPDIMADAKRYVKLNREYKELKTIVDKGDVLINFYANIDEAKELIKNESDPEMKDMAKMELEEIEPQLAELEEEIKMLLIPKDPEDSKNAVMEIRAGAGGDEAGIFAGDLFDMYMRYFEKQGYKTELLTMNNASHGGYKEVSVSIEGENIFGNLKFESGVHRVQRVPATESQGRVHTSAASVAVLPEAEDVDIDLNMKDVRRDTYRAQGAGGQHVNKTESAVRLTHIPTNTVVECQDGRSQHKNYDQALKVLRTKLYDMEYAKRMEEQAAKRKTMVSTGDRSAKIRTYYWPQGRVTDHRIGLTVYNLNDVMGGDIQKFIDELHIAENAERLKEGDDII